MYLALKQSLKKSLICKTFNIRVTNKGRLVTKSIKQLMLMDLAVKKKKKRSKLFTTICFAVFEKKCWFLMVAHEVISVIMAASNGPRSH